MSFTSNLTINVYSIVILIIIYIYSIRESESLFLQKKLFDIMLVITMIMLVLDTFSRFDGNPGTFYSLLNNVGNLLVFMLSPVPASLWLLYVYYEISCDEIQTKKLMRPLGVVIAINSAMAVLSLHTGWYYFIDESNVYHRGPLFMVPASLTIVLMAVSSLLIVANRNVIERKRFFSLVFFTVPPFAAIVLQVIFYGISVMLNGLAISLFIVFITIQNRRMDTDYLTGIYNRKRLESYLKTKISRSSENRTFSAVLIDLNNFKSINDNFGHNAGDEALAVSVSLIKSCIGSNDFLARYGGDEFCIVLDVSTKDELEQIIGKINCCIEKYNESAVSEYFLGFSMGYAVYDFHTQMTAEAFQKQIDLLMYQNKRTNKAVFHDV